MVVELERSPVENGVGRRHDCVDPRMLFVVVYVCLEL